MHTLRSIRVAAGLSVRELAARAGTSHATIVAYEQGRKVPRSDTRDRIIRASGWVVPPIRLRRVRVNERGVERGIELADVLTLADAFPAPARRPMDTPVFPARIGP